MTIAELDQKQAEEKERQEGLENRLYCCTAAGCISSGADRVRKALADEVKAAMVKGGHHHIQRLPIRRVHRGAA